MGKPPVLCIVGASGSGKTTLLERLIPRFIEQDLKVGTVKHDPYRFEMDKPGKDSWRHKQAGSEIAAISSPSQIGLVKDVDHDYTLDELATLFEGVDILLAEGYKSEKKPKIEVFNPELLDTPLCIEDTNLLAVVTDSPEQWRVPTLRGDDLYSIVAFILARFDLKQPMSGKRRSW